MKIKHLFRRFTEFPRVTAPLVPVFLSEIAMGREVTTFHVRGYRMEGAKKLKELAVEEAVYPFPGQGCGAEDVSGRARPSTPVKAS